VNNITQKDSAIQEESQLESKNAEGKNGFVHSGTSPTQGIVVNVSFTALNSFQELPATDKYGFNRAPVSSLIEREWLDICDRCGARRIVKTFCLVYCVEGRIERVTVCSSCRLLLEGEKNR
jgi:hypothetical protein